MIDNPFSLKGKTILVTGASSGIGKQTAITASFMGANVICVGRNENRLKTTLSQLRTEELINHRIIPCDLCSEEDIKELVNYLPVLDGVAFCAGVNERCLFSFFKEKVFELLLDTNLLAPIRLTKNLLKKKKIKRQASLVYISSIEGSATHTIGNGIYGISKNGLEAFVKTIALELAEKSIRCNSILPGRIETPMVTSNKIFSEEEINKDISNYPLKRYGKPEEIANTIVFLLSDAAMWMTGSSIIIDGGLSIK